MGRIALVLTAATLFATATPALADLTAQFNSTASNPSTNPATTTTQTVSNNYGASGSGITTWVGEYNWTRSGGSTPVSQLPFVNTDGSFKSFCVEISQNIQTPTATYTVTTLDQTPYNSTNGGATAAMGADRAAQIQKLFDSSFYTTFNANQYTAFQLAIWEIINEAPTPASGALPAGTTGATLDVTSGKFRMTSSNSGFDYTGTANGYLTAMKNFNPNTQSRRFDLYALTSGNSQDQVVFVPRSPGTFAVPEPTSVLLGLTGMGPLAAVVRLRRRFV